MLYRKSLLSKICTVQIEASGKVKTVHRHQSNLVKVQANNRIGWGAMAVLVQNCLMIYMIWSPRGEDNSEFWAIPQNSWKSVYTQLYSYTICIGNMYLRWDVVLWVVATFYRWQCFVQLNSTIILIGCTSIGLGRLLLPTLNYPHPIWLLASCQQTLGCTYLAGYCSLVLPFHLSPDYLPTYWYQYVPVDVSAIIFDSVDPVKLQANKVHQKWSEIRTLHFSLYGQTARHRASQ